MLAAAATGNLHLRVRPEWKHRRMQQPRRTSAEIQTKILAQRLAKQDVLQEHPATGELLMSRNDDIVTTLRPASVIRPSGTERLSLTWTKNNGASIQLTAGGLSSAAP